MAEKIDGFAAETRDYLLERFQEVKNRPGQVTYYEVLQLIGDIEEMRAALERIAVWDFDIAGDCVADAQKLARDTLGYWYE